MLYLITRKFALSVVKKNKQIFRQKSLWFDKLRGKIKIVNV